MTTFIQFQMRRDTTANWTSANPVLGQGELGLDTTLNRFKIGDGATAYNTLGYAPNTVFAGTGVPSAGLGVNGDIYFDKTVGAVQFYGPKAAGSWGSGVTLTGATGAPGSTGPTGPGVPVSPAGTTGQGLFKNSATALDDSWANTPVDGATLEITGNNVARMKDGGTTLPKMVSAPANSMLGEYTGSSVAPQYQLVAVNQFLARSSSGALSAKAISDLGLTWLGLTTVAAQTAALNNATTALAGLMSPVDKLKLNNLPIDVTANTIALVLTTNTAAANVTAMNLILAGAPNGSTIFFPHGLYLFNAAWTYPAATAKMFVFKGEGSNRAGSPATAYTELQWTANVGADIITLPSAGNGWYTEFQNIVFTSSATQTAGALINVNGNVGTNFRDCAFQSVATGQTFFDVLFGGGGATNSWNSAVIDNCSFQGFTNSAIRCNASGSSLVLSNSVIQGQWGTTAQIASACISMAWVGAFQILACDILGAVNNILSNPVAANSEVNASLQCTNTYFDFAGGSCIKQTGTGAFVRAKFDTCTFTTSNAGAGSFSAVELAGSFVYPTGGQDIAFVNCNIYNTFATTGTTNGVLITNAADVSFTNCKVAGWTNGYNITPMTLNKTNVQIIGGTVGPSGGFGGNAVGFLVAAGAYKGLQLRGVNSVGNTTALTLGAVTVLEAAMFAITENAGINPRGAVTIPGVPTAGTTVTNTTGFRVSVYAKNGATAPASIVLNGVTMANTTYSNVVTTGSNHFLLEPGGTIAFTTTTVSAWTWVGQ